MRRCLLLLVVLVPLLSLPGWADEARPSGSTSLDPSFRGPGSLQDASPQRRESMISVFLNFSYGYWGWGYGVPFGIGGRYYFPVLHDGFAPINDSLGFELGADLIAIAGNPFLFGLGVPFEAMWSLHFSRAFAAYLKLGVVVELHAAGWCWRSSGACYAAPIWFNAVGALGLIYKVSNSLALRFELGYPGAKIGLAFPL